MTDLERKAELKPCPFCGKEAGIGTVKYSPSAVKEQGLTQELFYFVNCIVCGTRNDGTLGWMTAGEAVEHWNTRVPSESQKRERDAFEAGVEWMRPKGMSDQEAVAWKETGWAEYKSGASYLKEKGE